MDLEQPTPSTGLTGTATNTGPAGKVSPIAQAFQKNAVAREHLQKVAHELREKLTPILSPEPPKDPNGAEKLSPSSDFEGVINGSTDDIHGIRFMIEEIIGRLTL